VYPELKLCEEDLMLHLPWDEVVCDLVAKKELATETVRVTVVAALTTTAETAPRMRAVVADALKSTLNAEWAFAAVERGEDNSGMERAAVSATTRVREQETAGLVERLKAASKPGLRLTLGAIEYTPPRAEIAAAFRELRRQVYKDAQAEADLLNQDLSTSERWRVGSIRIETHTESPERPIRDPRLREMASLGMRMRRSTSASADEEPEDESVSAVTRLTVTAKVTLKRPSIPAPEGGYFSK
jgi:hypothetical protein